MKHKILYIIIVFLAVSRATVAQNGMSGAVDVGNMASSFTYTDTKNTADYGNNHTMRSPCDVFYKFTLTRPMDIVISHCGSALYDTYVHLLNETGARIAYLDDYSGEGCCSNSLHPVLKKPNLPAGTYYVVSEGYSQNGNITTTIEGIRSISEVVQNGGLDPSNERNYITTRTYTSDDGTKYLDAVQYFDGLGRPVQTVQRAITPAKNDLVSLLEYDDYGRESTQWLPVPKAGNGGAFVPETDLQSVAGGLEEYSEGNPYVKTLYEVSPLNRVKEQYNAGEAWQNNGNSIKTVFLTNTASGERACAYYYVSGNNLVKNGNYAAQQLYVTRVTDENGYNTYEFKDKLGRVILLRQVNGYMHDTYYVYDDFGNLCFVLSPEGSDRLMSNTTFNGETNTTLKAYCYTYRYDHQNRCIYKRSPGSDPVYLAYDKGSRLIFSQDGEQRQQGKWMFSIPDSLGRTCITGLCTNSIDYTAKPFDDVLITVSRTNTTNTYKGYNINEISLSSPIVLTVNYYDNYAFIGYNGFIANLIQYEQTTEYGQRHENAKGLLIGTVISRSAMGGNYSISVFFYDSKGRIVQSKEKAITFTKQYMAYNFSGQLVKKQIHQTDLAGGSPLTENYTYEYDHAGRLTKHTPAK